MDQQFVDQLTPVAADEWSTWLHSRSGGNATYAKVLADHLGQMRDRVLDNARLRPGMNLLDVGSGDGLVPFGAIERLGGGIKVVFSDVSRPMLDWARSEAQRRSVSSQCTFCECSATTLHGVSDASVDVVTSRASLAFVDDKPAAFAAAFRVLRSGGRVSFCEPILQDEAFDLLALKQLMDADPNHKHIDIFRLDYRIKARRFPSTTEAMMLNPLTNFSERDLLDVAVSAGFQNVHVELHLDFSPGLITNWEVFLNTSPHPWAPTNRQILDDSFSPAECAYFEHVKRPLIESGRSQAKNAFAYLTAIKP